MTYFPQKLQNFLKIFGDFLGIFDKFLDIFDIFLEFWSKSRIFSARSGWSSRPSGRDDHPELAGVIGLLDNLVSRDTRGLLTTTHHTHPHPKLYF